MGRFMTHLRITVLPGDGIGPEVTEEAVRALRAVADINGYDFQFQTELIGGAAIRKSGTPLPAHTLDACLQGDAVLLGAVGGPEFDSLPSDRRPEAGLLGLRRALGAFANLRPAVAHPAIAACSPLRPEIARDTDLLVVRELTGGIYFGEPRGFTSGRLPEAFNTMRYSEREVERITRIAFEQALKRRRKVTSVDKANVLETSQLWRQVVTRVSREYPQVTLEHMYVDACAMHLVTNPTRFDVILTENLFGDILSDEAAVLAGSLGMMASASLGGRVGLYEPVHGSAPDIAGRGIANPLGAIATAALLLRFSAGMEMEAEDIENAISEVLAQGYRTADLGRSEGFVVGTSDMGRMVEQLLAEATQRRQAYHAV